MSDDHPADDPADDPVVDDQGTDEADIQEPDIQDQGSKDGAAASSGAAVAHASRHENPTDRAESLGAGLGDQATGDIVIDSALQDLQNAPADDLDAQIDAGQRVQQTLQARLSDLGGE